jgi:hypothetical protein
MCLTAILACARPLVRQVQIRQVVFMINEREQGKSPVDGQFRLLTTCRLPDINPVDGGITISTVEFSVQLN